MKKSTMTLMTVVAVLAILGISAHAFAGWGKGRGSGNCPGYSGRGAGMYQSGQGYYPDNLSDEQIKAIEAERQAFRNATEELRSDLYSKNLALRSELAKSDPDIAKAKQLQKEISGLQAQLDEERIDHMIKMRKISPEIGQGYGRGYGKGMRGQGGRGMGYGGGYGPCGGPGACWE